MATGKARDCESLRLVLIHTFYRELENFPPGNDSPGNDSTNENDVNKKVLARINGAMYEIESKAKSDITTYHELDNLATDLEDVLSAYTKNHEKLQDMKDPPMPVKKHSNSMKRGPIKLEAMEKDAKKKAKTLKKNVSKAFRSKLRSNFIIVRPLNFYGQ
jgi:hypothetical protein